MVASVYKRWRGSSPSLRVLRVGNRLSRQQRMSVLATFWKNSPNSVRAGAVRSLIKVLHGPAAAERALVNENVLIDLEDMGGKPPPGLFSVCCLLLVCLLVCLFVCVVVG